MATSLFQHRIVFWQLTLSFAFYAYTHPRKESTRKGVTPMSNEENKAVVRSAIDALNQKNWAALYDELTAPDFVLHDASTTIQGLEAYKEFISTFLTAFPD